MKTKIVGVLGLGVFGRTVAKELGSFGCEVIVVDKDPANVQLVADHVTNPVIGDYTDLDLLRKIGIDNCNIVVVASGSNLESAVLAVMHCKKLGVPRIITKARSTTFEEVLYEVGATQVVSPEHDSGFRLSSKILRNNIEEVLRLDDTISLIEFEVPKRWVGKDVREIDPRQKYDLNLIGMRQERGEPLQTIPVDAPFPDDIVIVAIANSRKFERYDYLNELN